MIVIQTMKLVEDINFYELSKWLEQIIIREKKISGDIVCVFCDDKYLLEKNIKYLNHDYLTDVITFNYSLDNKIEGEIFISEFMLLQNAKKLFQSADNELLRLISHGLLHLLGYKDNDKAKKKEMSKEEDFFIKLFHVKPS